MRRSVHAAVVAAAGAALMVGVTTAPPSGAADYSYTAKGKVLRVTDGDTFLGRVAAEGSDRARIRLSGVQAMERGQCHALEAERRLRQLLPHRSAVTVRARFKGSNVPNRKEADVRPLRLAFNSRGQDVQFELLRAGLVLPNLMRRETINQDLYWRTAQEAAVAGVGLWDADGCGSGPSQEAQLRVMVHYNADGNDRENPNGKYARVLNGGPTAIDLGAGFYLRTARHATFTFPAGTVLQPGGEVLVHQGRGTAGGGHFYWGNAQAFTNPAVSRYKVGGAYLVDRDGDIRASTLYPCQVSCVNPLAGAVAMNVIYDPEDNENVNPNAEMVLLTNISQAPADFSYHVLEVGDAEVHEFPAGTVVQPGETVQVHVGRGQGTRLDHYLGRDSSILPNGGSGAKVVLRTHGAVRVDCFSWGATSC